MHQMLEVLHLILPRHKPRYLMGVGSPEDLFECVARGVDQFDCVLPTRIARNGAVFTHQGRVNLRNARFARDKNPIEHDCQCYTCRTFSLAYLRHLLLAQEILALRLTTIHNLHFMLELMRRIRQSIIEGNFTTYKNWFLAGYQAVAEERRVKRST
jgi:queuine tRNA-ribosyltransferase